MEGERMLICYHCGNGTGHGELPHPVQRGTKCGRQKSGVRIFGGPHVRSRQLQCRRRGHLDSTVRATSCSSLQFFGPREAHLAALQPR